MTLSAAFEHRRNAHGRAAAARTDTERAPVHRGGRAQTPDQLSPEPYALVLTSFDEAKQLLTAHQLSLQLQAAAVSRAQADVEKALSQLHPRLELGAGADYAFVRRPVGSDTTLVLDSQTFVPNSTALLSVTFSLSRLASLSSSELQLDARVLNLSATRQQLIGGLAAAMLGLLSAERIGERTSAGYAAAQERMRITSRLAEVGSVTALNALRFSQDLSDAKSELVSAVEALSQARRALGQALGLRGPERLRFARLPRLSICRVACMVGATLWLAQR